MAESFNLPDFDSLPKVEGMPQGCAWGVFDKDGQKDRIGCLNLLTPRVIQEALKEAYDGVSISLNWPIGALKKPGFLRKGLEHKVTSFKASPFNFHGFDDEVAFNTQCSSQWDSLLHFAHQPTKKSYNDVQPTLEQLIQDFDNVDRDKALPTLNHWHDRGGLVGRGILLDYREYAQVKGIEYSCFSDHAITVQELEDIAKHQGTELRHGDIIIIRTGYTEDLGNASTEEQEHMLGTNKSVGVKGCKESAKWFWNRHFSAVAGDTLGFEQIPSRIEEEDNREGHISELGQCPLLLSSAIKEFYVILFRCKCDGLAQGQGILGAQSLGI
ncbi:hypothetical protein QX201_010765 [Fusarium graminearum]|nr:hypothetical protein FGRA07_11037 [Fusarium graminearum]CAG2001443.1 unnamed protein product [Fusarium graminearum]